MNCHTHTHPILYGGNSDCCLICLRPTVIHTPCSDSNSANQALVPCLWLQTPWCSDMHSGCMVAAVYVVLWVRHCVSLLPNAVSAHAAALVCTRCIVSVCWMGIRKTSVCLVCRPLMAALLHHLSVHPHAVVVETLELIGRKILHESQGLPATISGS